MCCVPTKPGDGHVTLRVNLAHQRNLRQFLRLVPLINADSIRPQVVHLGPRPAQPKDGLVQVPINHQRADLPVRLYHDGHLSVLVDLLALRRVEGRSPCIGQGDVGRAGVDWEGEQGDDEAARGSVTDIEKTEGVWLGERVVFVGLLGCEVLGSFLHEILEAFVLEEGGADRYDGGWKKMHHEGK